jgi:tRNA threonylcarbamoyladenosine biosynthesis protein TsaB
MALLLAIGTSTRLCSVAVGRDGMLLAERESESERLAHAESVNAFIDAVMREAGIAWSALQAVAVDTGPGSYTGLRIGMSAAKGLCFALGIPIIGIGTLDALMASAGAAPVPSWPMVDARRMEVFTQLFDAQGAPVSQPEPVVLTEAWAMDRQGARVFGDGADKAEGIWAAAPGVQHIAGIRPHARGLLPLAEQRLAAGLVDDLAYLVPRYGKEANVTQPGKRRPAGISPSATPGN